MKEKGKRKVQEVSQSQAAALPRHQEKEITDKTKQAQIELTYETTDAQSVLQPGFEGRGQRDAG